MRENKEEKGMEKREEGKGGGEGERVRRGSEERERV